MEQLTLILEVIILLGLSGLAWLVHKWITALKGTVDAQKATIDSLRTVLEVVDVPKMLDRMRAARQMAEEEKEDLRRKLEREYGEESRDAQSHMADVINMAVDLVGVFSHAIVFVPQSQRKFVVDAAANKDYKKGLLQIAAEAADLSVLDNRAWLAVAHYQETQGKK